MSYIDHISENRETESTLTSNKYDKTVTIKTRKGSITSPGLDFPEVTQNKLGIEKIGKPENEPKYVIETSLKINMMKISSLINYIILKHLN